jgi:carbonic anhydrase/acetyltransferase-like protein (isoleucine patch superfamily)
MLKVYSIDGVTPVVHPRAFVHPSAILIGDVIVGEGVYVGPCASLRGDFGRIVIRKGSNIQDCCIVHGVPDRETVIEENGHIGHGAIIHGAHIGANALVGMNAVINNYAEIGESAIVAALAFVKARARIAPRTLVAGIPARTLREVTQADLERKEHGTRLYQRLALRSMKSMHARAPFARESAKRKRLNPADIMPLSEYRKYHSR